MKLFLTFIYIIITGQGCFWGGLALPRSAFSENRFPYKEYDWERGGDFYEKFGIKKWKTKVPDMSKITRVIFPKKLRKNMTSEDIDRLVKESCIAELSHYVLFVLSFGIYYIWKSGTGILLFLLYNLIGNVPYVLIQRYNRPHLAAVRDKLKMREDRHANADC